jgi:uncharacterized protein (DUF2236 family)
MSASNSRTLRRRSRPRVALGLADIGGESALIAGGGRAILLQLAHPAVGHGVAAHSDFADRSIDRLRNTLRFVYAVAFGTPGQLAFVTREVNRAHRPVHAEATEGRPAYSAFDPQLQLWVAATLYDTAVLVHERIYGPLDEASADLLYAEYAKVGTALQMPAALWPPDRAAFQRYFDVTLAALRVDEVTRGVANALLHPSRKAPVWLRLAMPTARLVTAGLLPESLRSDFGLPWGPARERRFERLMTATSIIYPFLPQRLRYLPKTRAMASIPEA